MSGFVLSPQADRDFADILDYSETEHGWEAMLRYEKIILAGFRFAAGNPDSPLVRPRPEWGDGIFTYHLRHSRKPPGAPGMLVRHVPHFLVCRLQANQPMFIVRILHERMYVDDQDIPVE